MEAIKYEPRSDLANIKFDFQFDFQFESQSECRHSHASTLRFAANKFFNK